MLLQAQAAPNALFPSSFFFKAAAKYTSSVLCSAAGTFHKGSNCLCSDVQLVILSFYSSAGHTNGNFPDHRSPRKRRKSPFLFSPHIVQGSQRERKSAVPFFVQTKVGHNPTAYPSKGGTGGKSPLPGDRGGKTAAEGRRAENLLNRAPGKILTPPLTAGKFFPL